MDAEEILTQLFRRELDLEICKALYEDMESEEPIVDQLTKVLEDRITDEWNRQSNGLNNRNVHLIEIKK